MTILRRTFLAATAALLLADPGAGQFGPGGGRGFRGGNNGPLVRTEGGVWVNEDTVRTARETAGHSVDLPAWTNDPAFAGDTFTFARIIFKSRRNPGTDGLGWVIDYPDADLNLSFRLHELTSMRVNPDGRVLKLTDPQLNRYPFIYAEHVEGMQLSDPEVNALHNFLAAGGVLMVNDTWGAQAWINFAGQIARVLPGRSWTELGIDHPMFHCVFDLRGPMQTLQVPTLHFWNRSYDPADPQSPTTRNRGYAGYETMHVRAWADDKGRFMIVAVHNSDTSDGWEREGENADYFQQFSETRAYPLMINIVVYLMTH